MGLQAGPIPTVGAIRYLGVWFDANLLWHKHIREAVAGAKRSMWAMRRVVGKRWVAAPSVMVHLLNQVVLPKLFYGAECWGMVLRSERMLCNIDRTMSTGARLALGLDRFAPSDAALAMAGIMPARLQILRRLCRYMIRKPRIWFCFYKERGPAKDVFAIMRGSEVMVSTHSLAS